ncbi:tetratricopeptide repeat protein [Streptomyces sp. PsTaAH-124]|uniref:tetratricopeptide repeat protein n=1 Tax=Streptomyces sp. PsTaAH-124 TaxID=1157638 RepID=UPI00035F2CAA|nr:tetratricopeptide repeat protein [Streptomyces sp. PsTaAH-124]
MDAFASMMRSRIAETTGATLSGGGGEAARRVSELLFSLLNRVYARRGAGRAPVLPMTASEQSAAASQIAAASYGSQEVAREAVEWLHEAVWVSTLLESAVADEAARPQVLPTPAIVSVSGSEHETSHAPWRDMGHHMACAADGRPVPARVVTEGRERADRSDPRGRFSGDLAWLAYDSAYRNLSYELAALYRAVAVWPWPTFTVFCAARAAGVSERTAHERLERLADVGLVERMGGAGEGRYRLHGEAWAFAYGVAVAGEEKAFLTDAVRRMVVAQLWSAASADLRVMPLRWRLGLAYGSMTPPPRRDPEDGRRALAELRRERENLMAAVHAAAHHRFDSLVWQLCEAMWGMHLLLGFSEQSVEIHELGVESARRYRDEHGDARPLGRMLVQLSFGLMQRRRAADAERTLNEAVAVESACEHHRGHASAVEALGLLYRRLWRWAEAKDCYEQAREILGKIGPGDQGWSDVPRARALLDFHMGHATGMQGDSAAAVGRLGAALEQFRDLPGGDAYHMGRVHLSLGEIHLETGAVDLALAELDRAAAVLAIEGAELQLAWALELRARCFCQVAKPRSAAADLAAAARHYQEVDDHLSAARVRDRLVGLMV